MGAEVVVGMSKTWLGGVGWRRLGLIGVDEAPREHKRAYSHPKKSEWCGGFADEGVALEMPALDAAPHDPEPVTGYTLASVTAARV